MAEACPPTTTKRPSSPRADGFRRRVSEASSSSSDEETTNMDKLSKKFDQARVALTTAMRIIKPATFMTLLADLIDARSHVRRFTVIVAFLETYPILQVLQSFVSSMTEWIELAILGIVGHASGSKVSDAKIDSIIEEQGLGLTPRKESRGAAANLVQENPMVMTALGFTGMIATVLFGRAVGGNKNVTGYMRTVKEAAQTMNSLGQVFTLCRQAFASMCTEMLGITPKDPEAIVIKEAIQSMVGLLPNIRTAAETLRHDVSRYYNSSSWYCSIFDRAWKLEEECCAITPSTASFRHKYQQFLTEWRELRTTIQELRNSAATRPQPTVLWLFGPSGHGKTTLVTSIIQELSILEGRNLTSLMYNGQDQYLSGYRGQDVFIMDDFGHDKQGPDASIFINLVGSQVYRPNMAGLHEKGIIFSSKYIIVTSNLEAYTPTERINTPEAQHRRRDFVVKVVDARGVNNPNRHVNDDDHLTMTYRTPCGQLGPNVRNPEGRGVWTFADIGPVLGGRRELAQKLFYKAADHFEFWTKTAGKSENSRSRTRYPDLTTIPTNQDFNDVLFEVDDDDDTDSQASVVIEEDDDDDTSSVYSQGTSSTSRVVVIMGPPGVGKTTMLRSYTTSEVCIEVLSASLADTTLDHKFEVYSTNDITLDPLKMCTFFMNLPTITDRGIRYIVTANPKSFDEALKEHLAALPKEMRAEKKALIDRRLFIITGKFTRKKMLSCYTPEDLRDAYDKLEDGRANMTEWTRVVSGSRKTANWQITRDWLEAMLEPPVVHKLEPSALPEIPDHLIFWPIFLNIPMPADVEMTAVEFIKMADTDLSYPTLAALGIQTMWAIKKNGVDRDLVFACTSFNNMGVAYPRIIQVPVSLIFTDRCIHFWPMKRMMVCTCGKTNAQWTKDNILMVGGAKINRAPKSKEWKWLIPRKGFNLPEMVIDQNIRFKLMPPKCRAISIFFELAEILLSGSAAVTGTIHLMDTIDKVASNHIFFRNKVPHKEGWADETPEPDHYDSFIGGGITRFKQTNKYKPMKTVDRLAALAAWRPRVSPTVQSDAAKKVSAEEMEWFKENDPLYHDFLKHMLKAEQQDKHVTFANSEQILETEFDRKIFAQDASGFDAIAALPKDSKFLAEAFPLLKPKKQCGSHEILYCTKTPDRDLSLQIFKYVLCEAYGLNIPEPPWLNADMHTYDCMFKKAQKMCTFEQTDLLHSITHAYIKFWSWKLRHCKMEKPKPLVLRGDLSPFDGPAYCLFDEVGMFCWNMSEGVPNGKPWNKVAIFKIEPETTDVVMQTMELISKNMFRITAYYRDESGNEREEHAWCLGLKDRLYLTVSHIMYEDATFAIEVRGMTYELEPYVKSSFKHDFFILQGKLGSPQVRNIMNHWTNAAQLSMCRAMDGVFLCRSSSGTLHTQPVRYMNAATIHVGDMKNRELRQVIPNYVYTKTFTSKRGYCGAPYFMIYQGRPLLIGIHAAGTFNCGYMSPICLELLDLLFEAMGQAPVLEPVSEALSIAVALPPADLKIDQDPNSMKFQTRNIAVLKYQRVHFNETPHADGSVGHVIQSNGAEYISHTPNKTQIHKTPWFTPEAGEPAILSKTDPRNAEGIDPFEHSFKLWMRPAHAITPDLLEEFQQAKDAIIQLLTSKLSVIRPTIRRLTKTEAINYPTDIDGVNALEKSTSAGLPWKAQFNCGGKTPMIHLVPEKKIWELNMDHEAGKLLNSAIDALSYHCRKQIKTAVVFDMHLKDEVLPMRKIESVATRIILGCPVELSILHRQNLATLVQAICSLHNEIPVKVGINQYREWDILYKYFRNVGTSAIELDWKRWDSSVPSELLRMCGDIYTGVGESFGMTEETMATINGIYLHMSDPLICKGGRLYMCSRGMPSGQPTTSLDNCFINWMIHLVAFKKAVSGQIPGPLSCFPEYVALAVYGDDAACTVKDEILHIFKFRHILIIGIALGMEATLPNKFTLADPLIPHKPLDEVSFLSRGFNTNTLVHSGLVVGELKQQSLFKLISYVNCNKRHYFRRNERDIFTEERTCQELVNMGAMEIMLIGPENYKKFQRNIQAGCERYGIHVTVPSYLEVRDQVFPPE